jgi:hypothetical protein
MKIGVNKYTPLIKRLAEIIHSARATAVRQINKAQVLAYYEIGREIVEFEQKGKARAVYGEELIERLSRDMTLKFGRGFSSTNLKMMRLFYQSFPIRQTSSVEFDPQLSWSHYCELLGVEHTLARSFYEKEAVNNNWSFRELKRQINSSNDLPIHEEILVKTIAENTRQVFSEVKQRRTYDSAIYTP